MRNLLKIALQNRKHYLLMIITIASLFFVTISTQLEMFSIGILTNTGTDFFTLFGQEKKGRLIPAESVSQEDIHKVWDKIDKDGSGKITRQDATRYAAGRDESNPMSKALARMEKLFHFSNNFYALALLLVFVAVLKGASTFVSKYMTQVVSIRVSRDLRSRYFEHIQTLQMSFYNRFNIGSLATRVVGDASVISSAINGALTNYLHTPFILITTLGACFYLSWSLSLVIFCGLPILLIPIALIAKKIKKIARQMQTNQEGLSATLIDMLAGIQTIKLFSMEHLSLQKYNEKNKTTAKLEERSARYDFATRPILHTISTLFLASVLLYGLYVADMELSEVLVYCGLLWMFYEPIKGFADQNAQIQRGVVAAERMMEVLNLAPDIVDAPDAVELTEFKDSIVFDDVWFRYQDEWILKGVSFSIKKGQTVAIVGATGAGKSTIIQLLPRLYDVEKGQILIDGKSIKKYTQQSIRKSMALVPQKPFLFMDTISANIAFGQDMKKEEVMEAAKKAYADEFIERLPLGYDTDVKEGAKNFSGGQTQRLAIARALAKKAPILILDEATSSLDALSEERIKQAILSLHGEVTQVLIAHRLSTIAHADKIIFLERGEKTAEGNLQELLDSSLEFKEMWNALHKQKNKASE